MMAEVSLTAAPLKEKRRSISPSSRTSTAKKSGRSDDDRPIRKMQRRTNTKNRSWTLAMARVENVWAERVRHDWPVECARHSTILQTGKQQSREGRRYASFPGSSRGLVDLRRPMAVVRFRDVKSDHVHSLAPTHLPLVGKTLRILITEQSLLMF